MTWLLISAAVILVIGPMLVLLPSPRQKQQQSFRKLAMARGIQVELCRVNDPDPDPDVYLSATGRPLDPVIRCVAYRKTRHDPHGSGHQPLNWKLTPHGQHREAGLPETWSRLDNYAESLPPELMAIFNRLLPELPVDVIVVEEINSRISVYWRELEGEGALDIVCDFLDQLSEFDGSILADRC